MTFRLVRGLLNDQCSDLILYVTWLHNAIIAGGPVVDDPVELKASLRHFLNENLLFDAVFFAVFGYAFHFAVFGMRREVCVRPGLREKGPSRA